MDFKLNRATIEQKIATGAIAEPLPNMRNAMYEASGVLASKIEQYGLQFLMARDVVVTVQPGPKGVELMLNEPTPMLADSANVAKEPMDMVLSKIEKYGLQKMVEEGMVDININLKEKPVVPLSVLSAKKGRK